MKKITYKLTLLLLLQLQYSVLAQDSEIIAYYLSSHSPKFLTNKDLVSEGNGLVDYITIINYAFAVPKPDSLNRIIPVLSDPYSAYHQVYDEELSIDGIADDSSQVLKGQFNQFIKLKRINPNLKILISIGGWGGSTYFSDLALTKESREHFVNTCIDMFINGDLPYQNNTGGPGSAFGVFDGIDLDWEFPIIGGPEGTHTNPNDKENHTELLKLFREKLNEINPDLLLTVAVSGRVNELYIYNFSEDQKYLDLFNIMSYDLHGVWDNFTGHHTNLLSSELDIDSNKESLDLAVRYLIDSAGVEPSKIIPGAAFYGKGWKDVQSKNNGLYQSGEFINEWEYIRIKDYKNINIPGFNYYWDDHALAPYLYSEEKKIFWTFDDVRSIALKSKYVDAYNLGGLMFWQIFGDDSAGNMIKTIYQKNMPDAKFLDEVSENLSPMISISYPTAGSKFKNGDNIHIKTESSDLDGKIVKVDFLVNGQSIGYNTLEPFNWIWFNAKKGEHDLQCIAYDERGKIKFSNPVKVFIKN